MSLSINIEALGQKATFEKVFLEGRYINRLRLEVIKNDEINL
jgi:hypothetical protein